MKTDHLLFGAAYYSEYLPYDRVEKDMEMMEKAGMNTIRIAESTWSTIEPKDGIFDFTHLDKMLEAAARHHISVIVGTPTYAIPGWLCKTEYGYHTRRLSVPLRAGYPRNDGTYQRCSAYHRVSAGQ